MDVIRCHSPGTHQGLAEEFEEAMAKQNVAEQFVDTLVRAGVKRLYGVVEASPAGRFFHDPRAGL